MEAKYIKCNEDCVVRQCIDEVGGDPSEVCEWNENGICTLDTGKENNGMSLESIGIIFGVTRERIRQIEEKAFKKLKKIPMIYQFYEAIKGFKEDEAPDHYPIRY